MKSANLKAVSIPDITRLADRLGRLNASLDADIEQMAQDDDMSATVLLEKENPAPSVVSWPYADKVVVSDKAPGDTVKFSDLLPDKPCTTPSYYGGQPQVVIETKPEFTEEKPEYSISTCELSGDLLRTLQRNWLKGVVEPFTSVASGIRSSLKTTFEPIAQYTTPFSKALAERERYTREVTKAMGKECDAGITRDLDAGDAVVLSSGTTCSLNSAKGVASVLIV